MKKQSQCNRVMQYMRDFGSISTREAFDDLGVTRLSGRIYDLKNRVYRLRTVWKRARTATARP